MNRTAALIPLRGGSKSIKKKNIKPIAGKPLCEWVLEAALNSHEINRVYVSTDSSEIVKVVKSVSSQIEIIDRPPELASDTASTESVMLHFTENIDYDILATIQATSPLVTSYDLDSAIKYFEKEKFDSLLTGVLKKQFFWKIDGTPLNYNPEKRPRRQEFEGIIHENGSFYLTRKNILLKNKCRIGGRIGFYLMSEKTSVELDEPEDWTVVEQYLQERKK